MKTSNIHISLLLFLSMIFFAGCEKLDNYSEGRYVCKDGDLEYLELVNGTYILWAEDITAEQQEVVRDIVRKMVRIDGGTFLMGRQKDDPSAANYDTESQDGEFPTHNVTLSAYSLGTYEVTQYEWAVVMGSSGDWTAGYGLGGNYPVYNIRYTDALLFIEKINGWTGLSFRLPTEAEWEYAARGGNDTHAYPYSGSDDLASVAWYKDNADYTAHEVGSKRANELGLYDMSGNVCEWCSDYYGFYAAGSQTNPQGAGTGTERVVRGGSFCYLGKHCKCAARDHFDEEGHSIGIGFRLAMSL